VLLLAACCANAALDRAMTNATTVAASPVLIIPILPVIVRLKHRPRRDTFATTAVPQMKYQ
jgi:hypothetical protein